MIPAYSPQAGARSERRFGTWQGRLPQELRLRGVGTVEEGNQFLRERYIMEINRKFSVPAAEQGHAFVPVSGPDLDRIFSIQKEGAVAKDNTVRIAGRVWQIERTAWRSTLAGCRVLIAEQLDGRVAIRYGPRLVGPYTAQALRLAQPPQGPAPRRRGRLGRHGYAHRNWIFAGGGNVSSSARAGFRCHSLVFFPSFSGKNESSRKSSHRVTSRSLIYLHRLR